MNELNDRLVPQFRRDRRCVTRPNFVTSWRKTIGESNNSPVSKPTARQDGHIDIWVANARALFSAQSCLKILTKSDWASLTRLRDPSARFSAIAAKILLRLGLSRAVNYQIAPSQWQFGQSANDKPILINANVSINFSVSHVDELAVVAVSPILNVGIDIEGVDQTVSEGVFDGYCHVDERHQIRKLAAPQKSREFIRLWTLKEAYSKAIGIGHALDFKTLNFLPNPITSSKANHGLNLPARFEKFYVADNHALFHCALAIHHPAQNLIPTELRIINLVDSKRDGEQSATPVIY